MPRIIEIVLFLTPFFGFAVWRLLPSPTRTPRLLYGFSGVVVLLLIALVWTWYLDVNDANQPYVPDELRDSKVISVRPR